MSLHSTKHFVYQKYNGTLFVFINTLPLIVPLLFIIQQFFPHAK